jgi:release factor glutamine methyltransferase
LAERLKAVGLSDPLLEAEVLVRHVTGLDRVTFFRDGHRLLTLDQQASLETLATRRLGREPLAYILGHFEFYGLVFAVDPRVLIPRQETETLVDVPLSWMRQRSYDGSGLTIADVGTGSGCVAVSLAVQLPQAILIASDISAEALVVARLSAERHRVVERIQFREGDLLDPLDDPVDAIVANLPYVADSQAQVLAPEILRYEPHVALFAGGDGLALLRRLLVQAPAHLRPGSALFLEVDPRQAEPLHHLASRVFPNSRVTIHRDLAGLLRVFSVDTAGDL